jgi:hypothetical protein
VRREYFRDYVPWRFYVRGLLARERRCTRCGDDRVRPTHTPFGWFLTLLHLVSMRCIGCTMKFALRRGLAEAAGPEDPEELHVPAVAPPAPEAPAPEAAAPEAPAPKRTSRRRSRKRPGQLP